jgi:hypothetical protein
MKHTWQLNKTGLQIPMIPIGIEYESLYRPRTRVFPHRPQSMALIFDQSRMIKAITQQLGELSGLSKTRGFQAWRRYLRRAKSHLINLERSCVATSGGQSTWQWRYVRLGDQRPARRGPPFVAPERTSGLVVMMEMEQLEVISRLRIKK